MRDKFREVMSFGISANQSERAGGQVRVTIKGEVLPALALIIRCTRDDKREGARS